MKKEKVCAGNPLGSPVCFTGVIQCRCNTPLHPQGLSLCAGYDMEDAMILNKSAVERGLAHGTIFKTETLNLKDDRGKSQVGSTAVSFSVHKLC